MNMRRLLTITLLFTALQGYAQSVSIIKDPRIDMLLKKQAELIKQIEQAEERWLDLHERLEELPALD